jgi:hypothetical protein
LKIVTRKEKEKENDGIKFAAATKKRRSERTRSRIFPPVLENHNQFLKLLVRAFQSFFHNNPACIQSCTQTSFTSGLVKQLLGIVQFWIDDFHREFHCQESHTDILPIKIGKLF